MNNEFLISKMSYNVSSSGNSTVCGWCALVIITVHWFVTFVLQCNYLVSTVICIFLFLAFQQHQYVSPANAPCLVALLCLYG